MGIQFSSTDRSFMKQALRLATAVKGRTWPNPPVGAVLVKNGAVLSVGATRPAGQAHAERVCLEKIDRVPEGATLYVTLEPCSHFGKTPPCTELILTKKISRVVVATTDPNPLVNGKGLKILQQAGVKTETGLMEAEGLDIIREFAHFLRTGRPFVTLKYAMTLDGKLAADTGDSQWISGQESRSFVHRLRKEAAAVLVGAGTVLHDNPRLTCRLRGVNDSYQPLKLVLTPSGRIPEDREVVSSSAPATFITTALGAENLHKINPAIPTIVLDRSEDLIPQTLERLGGQQIVSLLIEGGPATLTSFIKSNAVDRLVVFVAPSIIGGDKFTPVQWLGFERMADKIQFTGEWRKFDNDICFDGLPLDREVAPLNHGETS